jgi:hypothetical protein
MVNNKTCDICYKQYDYGDSSLKCRQCTNEVCDDCYSNIVFNNELFIPNFILDRQQYDCPFCRYTNTCSTKINHFNTCKKLIKLLIYKMNKNNIRYNSLVDDLNYLRTNHNEILNENNDLNNQLNNLRNFNFKLLNENKDLKNQLNNVKLDSEYKIKDVEENNYKLALEYKPINEKLEKIESVIKNTKRETVLFNQINFILNE